MSSTAPATQHEIATEGVAAQSPVGEGVLTIVPSAPQHLAKAFNYGNYAQWPAELQTVLSAMGVVWKEVAAVKAQVTPKESSVPVQSLRVKEHVATYTRPDDWSSKRRHQWHFKDVELWPESSNFLSWVRQTNKAKKQDAVDAKVLNARVDLGRLWSMFETEDGEPVDAEGLLVNMVRSGAIVDLLRSDAFADDMDFTRQIVGTMNLLRQFQASALRDKQDWASIEFLSVLDENKLRDVRKGIADQREASKNTSLLHAFEKAKNAAPAEDLKRAVKNAMCNLEVIAQAYSGKDSMPVAHRSMATHLVLFIVYSNGLAGRPMEWATFLRKDCLRMMHAHPSYVYMTNFKTARNYVMVGKHLAPGTHAALLAYLTLPTCDGKPSPLVFPPTPEDFKRTWKGSGDGDATTEQRFIQVNDSLSRGYEIFLPGFSELSPTLLRKISNTKVKNSDTSLDYQQLALLDTHAERTADAHYDYSKVDPEALSKQGERMYFKYMGEPVSYPTFAELTAAGRSLEAVTKRGYRCADEAITVSEELARAAPAGSPSDHRKIIKGSSTTAPDIGYYIETAIPADCTMQAIRAKSVVKKRAPPTPKTLERSLTRATTPEPPKTFGPKKIKRPHSNSEIDLDEPRTPASGARPKPMDMSGAKESRVALPFVAKSSRWDLTLDSLEKILSTRKPEEVAKEATLKVLTAFSSAERRYTVDAYDGMFGKTDEVCTQLDYYAQVAKNLKRPVEEVMEFMTAAFVLRAKYDRLRAKKKSEQAAGAPPK